MQSSSTLCCSSNSISPSNFQRFTLLSTKHQVNVSAAVFSSSSTLPVASWRAHQSSGSTINSSAAPELVETNSSTSGFDETGCISGVHGLRGEERLKPSTDFPDLRFSKESGKPVGIVLNVFNTGASDLLHVRLNMSKNIAGSVKMSEVGECDSGPLVWVPFVEAIVPEVDLGKREMLIKPPKGLLDLNIRSHERSKKERRELEWKERKKFQRQLIAAKKKLREMEQQHFMALDTGRRRKQVCLQIKKWL